MLESRHPAGESSKRQTASAAIPSGTSSTLTGTSTTPTANTWLNAEGAATIAHENTHKHLLVAQRVENWDYTFPSCALAPGRMTSLATFQCGSAGPCRTYIGSLTGA